MVALRAALAFYFIDKPTESLPSFQSMYPWCLNSHTLLTTGQRKISRCSKNREINSTQYSKISLPLKNAYCVRKSSTITFLCNHAICNVRSFSTEVKFTVHTNIPRDVVRHDQCGARSGSPQISPARTRVL